jgi:hypothetical protein
VYWYFSGLGSLAAPCFLLLVVLVFFWMDHFTVRLLKSLREQFFVILPPKELRFAASLVMTLMLLWKLLPVFPNFAGLGIVLIDFFNSISLGWARTNLATTIMVSCIAVVLLYMLSLTHFFTYAKAEMRKDGGIRYPFAIWAVHLLTLGVSYVIFGTSLSHEANVAFREIVPACETGERTHDLFITSQVLQSLRQTAGCIELSSVEKCGGFVATKYSDVLKEMEVELRCAGFCYNATSLEPLTFLPLAAPEPYPPTLFSQANFEASCDGMAARSMMYIVSAAGQQINHQGITLTIAALTLGMLVLLGACSSPEKQQLQLRGVQTEIHYGAAI